MSTLFQQPARRIVDGEELHGFSPDSQRIFFIRNQLGFATLWEIELTTALENKIELNEEYTWLESLAVSRSDDLIALVASGGRKPPEIIITDPSGRSKIIQKSTKEDLPVKWFSQPEPISLDIWDDDAVHGLFYKPHHPEYEGEDKPPLLIIIHSGPTRQKYAEFQPRTQYFTSRGYGVFEINYHGSTGYGRNYWEVLNQNWGDIDVEDVKKAADKIKELDLVDPERIVLMGSSSGGYTVYQLLIRYPTDFQAAVVLYGISDLFAFSANPLKFESNYDLWLVGPLDKDSIRDLSPVNSAKKIETPLIIFQGGEDPVVPQKQAEAIVEQLQKNNVPHEYHLYPEEGHGFQKSETLNDFYQKTEVFLKKYVMDQ